MKLRKKLFTGFLAVALAVSCFLAAGMDSKAAYTPVYNGNYDQYGFDKYGFDKYGIKYELGNNYNNAKTKMRIYADDASHLWAATVHGWVRVSRLPSESSWRN